MTDPQFPNRPDHPDFWLMAEAVQDLDTASEDGVEFQRVIGDIDLESLAYMAQQRTMRVEALRAAGDKLTPAAIGGAWLDGFMSGARFRKIKDERKPMTKRTLADCRKDGHKWTKLGKHAFECPCGTGKTVIDGRPHYTFNGK